MDLAERIEELGYHADDSDYSIVIYLNGNFIAKLYRFERPYNWLNKYGKTVDLSNIKLFLEKESQ